MEKNKIRGILERIGILFEDKAAKKQTINIKLSRIIKIKEMKLFNSANKFAFGSIASPLAA